MICGIWIIILTAGVKDKTKLDGWRLSAVSKLLENACYIGLLTTGHYKLVNKKVDLDYSEYLGPEWKSIDNERAPIIIANHVSFVDNMIMIMKYLPRFIARISFKTMPVIGTMADTLNSLYIERVGTNAKESKK